MFYVRGLNGHRAVRTWKVAIAAWLLFAFVAAAQDAARPFDIPAQPLEQAVERFSVASGWSVMYAGDLAAGRRSHALQATLPPAEALRALLRDTGVEADMIGTQRVVLRLAAGQSAAVAEPLLAEAERRRRFGGLQQRLRAAFCGDLDLHPGGYAATLRFNIAADGQVHDAELVSGSGSARRDARLLQAMHALVLPAEAAGLPQPVTLQIHPSTGDHDCGGRAPLP
ncbi:TPA: TonB-dependent receptor [Stenotrophomonas maltophilia]|nr:TonB-dependent receptor [Stenotrophomonas maltophilia]HDS1026130.1 TonB-dependent receptor [Stenotrophomonas maltophilia]HDS1032450.1 TonB-dependent receptor [Stenotrophomonas maltophilia]HDS1034847.1 TonB-dependent receptor [Stenotrophomonas maltophilia]